jgi:hypothetical protein
VILAFSFYRGRLIGWTFTRLDIIAFYFPFILGLFFHFLILRQAAIFSNSFFLCILIAFLLAFLGQVFGMAIGANLYGS